MKTVFIGDVHGRNTWKLITHMEKNVDRMVFIGDYFDSFDIKPEDQCNNFLDIIEFKKKAEVEVICLVGNHDLPYIVKEDLGNSGYQRIGKYLIEPIIEKNLDFLQMAFKDGEILCTHAGVSPIFMNNVFGTNSWKIDTIDSQLNDLFKYKPFSFAFDSNIGKHYSDPYGDDVFQTPLWIRPKSLMRAGKDIKKDVIQIVGHTTQNEIDIKGKSTGGRYYFIDVPHEYLILENNIFCKGSTR